MKVILLCCPFALLLASCGDKELPAPRSRDEIFRERVNLPVLYMTTSGKRVEAPGGQGSFVDKASGEICWMAVECNNPECLGRSPEGEPYLFIKPEPGVFVNSRRQLDYDPKKAQAAFVKGGFFGCEKCIPLRQKQMLQSGLGAEPKATIERYTSYVVPHVLPETKKRLAELEAEMVARVNWEKGQAGED